MASTDAIPVPRKNVAYRVIFPIFDNTGALVTGAAGLDSEVSKDQGTFTDCTNEATEIATSSGIYYLDVTSTEMNADCTAIIVKTSTTNAKTTVIILYPQEAGDIKVDFQTMAGTTQTARDLGASVLLSPGTGTGQVSLSSGAVLLQATQTGVTIPTVTTLTNAPGDSSGVTTLLSRIPSGLFTGITSMAQWLGLLAGKQTGNATARTEVRATGGGSGTFDETTDSQEAIRDNMGVLTSSERNAIADAYLDRTDAVESGVTPRGHMRVTLAGDGGLTTGAATSTFTAKNPGGTKNRIVATTDTDGNRTAITLDTT